MRRLAAWLITRVTSRAPDVVIGGEADPYLRRWWLLPRNWIFNVYLHEFVRSDDDRALHDHMYFNCSILLRGKYFEHTIAAGGVRSKVCRIAGDVVFRSPWRAHRIELFRRWLRVLESNGSTAYHAVGELPCWSLFITGPRMRSWGFHCPDAGWIHWRKFTNPATNGTTIGQGCGDG